MGFEDLCVTNRHVYLLLNGKFAKDKPYANEILVMDWDGNVIKKYQLDCDIKTMAGDENNGVFFGITFGVCTETKIVRFPFFLGWGLEYKEWWKILFFFFFFSFCG